MLLPLACGNARTACATIRGGILSPPKAFQSVDCFCGPCGKIRKDLRGVFVRGPHRKYFRWGKFSGSPQKIRKDFMWGIKKQDVIRPVFPLLRQARADVLFSSRKRVRPESIRVSAKSFRHTSVNSLLEQEGQGGSLSYSPTLTSVRQLVQR